LVSLAKAAPAYYAKGRGVLVVVVVVAVAISCTKAVRIKRLLGGLVPPVRSGSSPPPP